MGSSDRTVVRQNQPSESQFSYSEQSSTFQPLILSTPYARMLPAPISVDFVPSPSAYIEDSFRYRIEPPKEKYQSHFTDDNYQASSDLRDYEGRPHSPRLRSQFLKESIGFQSRFTDDNYRLSSDSRDYEGRPNSSRLNFTRPNDSGGYQSRFTDDNYWLSSNSRDY